MLPSSAPPDLLASLQLADLIRSSAIPPLAATKSLLRRLKHENPNVQLLALSVLDICVKNGGTPFLVQVAGKESASDIESLARGTPSGNRDVKEKVMSKLQDWATAFAAKENLRSSELVRSYERMKNEGLPFPPRDPTATAAMVDSLSVSRIQSPTSGRSALTRSSAGSRVEGCSLLHEMSHRVHDVQSQASLPELRRRLRPGVLRSIRSSPSLRHH